VTGPPENDPTRAADLDVLPRDLDGFPYRVRDNHAVRVTTCCGAYPTYHDSTLCCRACWHEVDAATDQPVRIEGVTPLRPQTGGPHRSHLPPPDPPLRPV
jgi:hypothetical protein